MHNTAFEKILEQIASTSRLPAAEVREKMQLAMESALKDPSPAVQAMWQSIPKQGDAPTLDEFMEYLIDKNLLSP